jgi:hypothetical protein
MPFRNDAAAFSTEAVQAMTAAYDLVVEQLKLPLDDPRRGRVVSLIVQPAKAGVLEVDKLADQARAGLR